MQWQEVSSRIQGEIKLPETTLETVTQEHPDALPAVRDLLVACKVLGLGVGLQAPWGIGRVAREKASP